MTQTITTQRKTKNGVRHFFWPLFCAMFFLSLQAMGQSKVTWQSNTPVQSSGFTVFGADGYLDFNILVTDANIPNAAIAVALPAGVDYVGLTNQSGMTATIGSVTKTGSLAAGWNLAIPVTSNSQTLKINDVVSVRVGIKATCSVNMSAPGQFSVTVSGSSGTITNPTKSIPLSVRKPSVRMNPGTGGSSRTYATIGESKTFNLVLTSTGGTANSVLVKFTYEGNVVTLDNFKIGGTSIPAANIGTTGTTTKTTTVKLTIAELVTPIDLTAKEITFDASSNLGCDRTITTQLQFDATNNCETVTCDPLVLKLPSESGVPTFSVSHHFQMSRDLDAAGVAEKRGWDYFCFDGTTPGYAHFTFTNTNNQAAAGLGFSTWVEYGAWSTLCSYIDTTDVYCRINGGSEIKIPGSSITYNSVHSSSDPSILAPLQGKSYSLSIKLPPGLNVPAGAKVEVRYAFYLNPSWRDTNIRKSREYYRPDYNTIDVGYNSVFATNICGARWNLSIGNTYCANLRFPRFYYKSIAQNVKPNKSGVLSNYITTGSYNSSAGTNSTGRRATEIFVKLPSWMSLDYTSDITEAFTIGTTSPVAGTGQSYGDNTYSVSYETEISGNLNVKYKTGTCGASTGLQNDTVKIWADFISGTPTSACRPRFECQTQIFQLVSLNCNDKGMMMDTMYLYRQTRGLRDSNGNHYPDDGTKALDSEINHNYYAEGDTGYYCVKGYIQGDPGDSFKKLYTKLKLSQSSTLAIQYKFGTNGHFCPLWDKATIAIKPLGTGPVTTYPVSVPTVSSIDSIYALYDGEANSYLLQPQDSVELRIPFYVPKGGESDYPDGVLTVESYATNNTQTNPFLPNPTERFGLDLMTALVRGVKPKATNGAGWYNYSYTSLTTPQNVLLTNYYYLFPNFDFPKEVRYLETPLSSEIRIPYGFVLSDGLIQIQTITDGSSVFVAPVSRREDLATGDSIFTVDLTTVFDMNYDGSPAHPTLEAGKLFLGDDQQAIRSYANILPTPALTPGVKGNATGTYSATLNSGGNVNYYGSSWLVYNGPSLSSQISPSSIIVNSETLSVASLKLINAGPITDKNVWLYIDGNVRDASLIDNSSNTITGEGLNGRWINVGDIASGAQKEYRLNFIYTGGTSCDGDTVRIYTVADFLESGFIPDIDQSISVVKSANKGQRQTLLLNNSASKSKISGSVIANVSALAFNTDYTADVTIDGRGSQGALNDPRVAISVPAGQLYKAGTATVEYPVGTITPVSADFEQLLVDELGNSGTLANARTFNARLADALDRASIMLPGWGADVSLGYTDNDRIVKLHFTFTPKCETPLTGIRYRGVFTGKSACGQDVIDNGLVSITNPAIYTNVTSDYSFNVSLVSSNSTERAFSPEKTTDVLTATFNKITNVNTIPVMGTDSIQLVLPKYLDISGSVTCATFPGVVVGSNIVDGDLRTITLSLPASQLNGLMATNAAGTVFSYQIPVTYTADDQSLATAPLQNIVAQVVTNLRFDTSCTPRLATIGTANMDMLFVTFTEDPYLACLNIEETLEVTSSGVSCKWYKELAKTNLLSSAITYDYTPITQSSSIFYLEATYNSIVYGTVPITVNMHPAASLSITAPSTICDGSSIDLSSSSIVSATPSNCTVKYYSDIACGSELTGCTVTPTANTTYYAQASTTNGCLSSIEAIAVSVNPVPSMTAPANQTFSPGTTAAITLSGTNATGFTWSGGATIGLADGTNATQIPSFTAVNTGTAAVTRTITVTSQYTSGSTCDGTPVTFTITVNPPVSGGSFANTSVCSATTCTGVIPAGGNNVAYYQWTGGSSLGLADGTGTTNTSIPSFTASTISTSTTATITVTPYNSANIAGATTTFDLTVNPTPTVTVSHNKTTDGACSNSDVVFTTQSGMSNYAWSINGATITSGATATSNTATLKWTTAGTKTVTVNYENSTGCSASSVAQATVLVNPTPVAGTITNKSVCSGLTHPAITPTGGTNVTYYTWSGGSSVGLADYTATDKTTIPTFTAATVTAATTATITVVPHYKNGTVTCDGTATTFTITVNPLPIVTLVTDKTNDEVCVNTNITFTTESGMTNYVWNLGGATVTTSGGTSTSNTAVLQWNSAGTKTVTVNYTNANGCTATAVTSKSATILPATAITTQPSVDPAIKLSNDYIIPGSIVDLDVVATGSSLTYQWYWKKLSDGTVVTLTNSGKYSGATSANFSISNAYEAENGDYYVTVTGPCGSVTSTPVTVVGVANQDASLKDLKVNGATLPEFNPAITSYMTTVPCVTEQVTILGIPNNPNYTSLTGNGTYHLEPGDNLFTITVVAQDMVTTMTYTVNVIRDCYIPKILKDLEDAVICVGDTHTFQIDVQGENLTYEWYYGLNRIMGANTNSLTISDAVLGDYERYYVVIRSHYNGFKSSVFSKKVRLWVADQLPTHLRFSEYPNPAITGNTYHIKVDGYTDVTKYTWSYDREGLTFSPGADLKWGNEAWATFGTLSAGNGILKVTMEHPCGTRELALPITVKYPTGIEDVTATTVQVYPNPTSGILKVSGTEMNQQIRVLDVTGSLKGTYKTQEGTTTIDLTGYAKGTYMVQYNGKAYKVIKK